MESRGRQGGLSVVNYDEMMAELRRDYLNSMPAKISDIKEHAQKGEAEKLRDDFHKLKGTGKTYGIPEISELGEAMEKLCLSDPQAAMNVARQAAGLLESIATTRSNNNQQFTLSASQEFQTILARLKP